MLSANCSLWKKPCIWKDALLDIILASIEKIRSFNQINISLVINNWNVLNILVQWQNSIHQVITIYPSNVAHRAYRAYQTRFRNIKCGTKSIADSFSFSLASFPVNVDISNADIFRFELGTLHAPMYFKY